ncbi:hypothetical protein C473_00387 [Halorubrum distributum JCM 10247]|uniref:Uncharacterized protein n=1 Tax=Halorubrum distributum JCM 10247 TaxID=1227486 RepID=M0DRN9_9EURY|nr:hypothetical protein C473_00387 [Halorubrum terrestre JCM 10247]
MFERNRFVVRFRKIDGVEVVVYLGVWCDLAAIDDLYRSRPREHFRNGADAKECLVRLNRDVFTLKGWP